MLCSSLINLLAAINEKDYDFCGMGLLLVYYNRTLTVDLFFAFEVVSLPQLQIKYICYLKRFLSLYF